MAPVTDMMRCDRYARMRHLITGKDVHAPPLAPLQYGTRACVAFGAFGVPHIPASSAARHATSGTQQAGARTGDAQANAQACLGHAWRAPATHCRPLRLRQVTLGESSGCCPWSCWVPPPRGFPHVELSHSGGVNARPFVSHAPYDPDPPSSPLNSCFQTHLACRGLSGREENHRHDAGSPRQQGVRPCTGQGLRHLSDCCGPFEVRTWCAWGLHACGARSDRVLQSWRHYAHAELWYPCVCGAGAFLVPTWGHSQPWLLRCRLALRPESRRRAPSTHQLHRPLRRRRGPRVSASFSRCWVEPCSSAAPGLRTVCCAASCQLAVLRLCSQLWLLQLAPLLTPRPLPFLGAPLPMASRPARHRARRAPRGAHLRQPGGEPGVLPGSAG